MTLFYTGYGMVMIYTAELETLISPDEILHIKILLLWKFISIWDRIRVEIFISCYTDQALSNRIGIRWAIAELTSGGNSGWGCIVGALTSVWQVHEASWFAIKRILLLVFDFSK